LLLLRLISPERGGRGDIVGPFPLAKKCDRVEGKVAFGAIRFFCLVPDFP
jgi:hypothetical protein